MGKRFNIKKLGTFPISTKNSDTLLPTSQGLAFNMPNFTKNKFINLIYFKKRHSHIISILSGYIIIFTIFFKKLFIKTLIFSKMIIIEFFQAYNVPTSTPLPLSPSLTNVSGSLSPLSLSHWQAYIKFISYDWVQ